MRKELELIEQIENYLMDKLNPLEKSNFEAQIQADNSLQASVDFQQNLIEGIQRMGLKKDTINAQKRYKIHRVIKGTVITLCILLAAAACYYFYAHSNSEGQYNLEVRSAESGGQFENEIPLATLPIDDTLSCEANQLLDQELFQLKTDRDTVIETENGIVIFVPANAFDTENNAIDFVVQEALNPADIMYAGLNTLTLDDDSLETGGMFYFDAFAEGDRIPLKKELTVDIPLDRNKTGMQLYEGVETDSGELRWTNPKPITKPLVSVEITDLDFYPPGYESKMEDWGYVNTKFKDSLYYSFASECYEENFGFESDQLLPSEAELIEISEQTTFINGVRTQQVDTLVSSLMPALMFMPIPQDPSPDRMPNNVDDVITWNFSLIYTSIDEALITMNVTQKNGWHIYSQNQPEGAIPLPTEFDYNEGKNQGKDFDLIGRTNEFGVELSNNNGFPERSFHGKTARFTQKIKLNSEKAFSIRLHYGYMACLTACLPPEYRTQTINIKRLQDRKITNDLDGACVDCGVNPASVQAIWNSKFNHTNLATKAFEERMPLIHQTCNNDVFQLYVNHLDKNLYEVDSMAMRLVGGNLKKQFAKFASRKEGKVELSTDAQKSLATYYKTKRNAIQKAIQITQDEYWAKQIQLDTEMSQAELASSRRNNENIADISEKEIVYNTNRVYASLGMQKPKRRPVPAINFFSNSNSTNTNSSARNDIGVQPVTAPTIPIRSNRSFLRANINSTGWKNVDRIISLSRNRESSAIRSGNGKTTQISYSPMNITIANAETYDRVNVYVVPKTFNSFIRLSGSSGKYNYRLNDHLNYDLVVIAWNDGGFFYSTSKAYKGQKNLELKVISKLEWETKISTDFKAINGMSEEFQYLDFAKKDKNRKNKNKALRDLKDKARPYVFPCACLDDIRIIDESLGDTIAYNSNIEQGFTMAVDNTSDLNDPDDGIIDRAEVDPQFPGGLNALNTFLVNNIKYPTKARRNGISGTVYVSFLVKKSGEITNEKVQQGVNKELDAEALRLIKLMPNWEPGKMGDQIVDVGMTLPIDFGLE